MQTLIIQRTHEYNPDYSHLETCEEIGKFESYRKDSAIHDEGSLDETHEETLLVLVDRNVGVTDDEIEDALADTYRRGCSCSHDCCGHWFGGMSHSETQWITPKLVRISLHYSRNY